MLSMTTQEKIMWKEESKQITLTFDDGTVLTNEDIYYESFSLEQALTEDKALKFGKCIPSEVNIKIYNIPKSHIGSKMNIGIQAGTSTWNIGDYTVVEDKLTDDKQYRHIKAYDSLYNVNSTDVLDWYNGLQFPMELKAFRDSFFDYVGVEQKETTLANDSMVIEQTVKPNALSGKDVIESICEVNACFGQVDYDGKFKYVILETGGSALYPSDTLYPSDYLFPKDVVNERMTESSFKLGTLKYEDFLVKKITQIQVRMEEGDIGVTYGIDGNTYVIEDNFLLYGKNQQQLSEMAMNFFTKLHFVEYSPLSVETQGEPWLELGDFVKVVNGRDSLYFPILHRTLKGIQSLSDTFEAQGVERYTEKVNGIQNEIIKLKGKSNTLTRNIKETRSEISNLDSYVKDNYLTTLETQSAITQSAEQINLRVDSVQRQVNGQVNTWYGTVAPTLSNYPANQWNTDELKDNHNGDKYFVRDTSGNILKGYRFLYTNNAYGWQEMSDTDVTQALNEALKAQQQVEELRSDVDITAKQIQATVGQSTTKYVTSYNISYNGFGNPQNNAYLNGTNPLNKYYMNQLNGEIWRCTAYSSGVATWSKVGTAQTTADYTQSQITATAKDIQATVAQSVTEWNTADYAITYRGYGQPSQYYSASGNSGKYYLNQQNGYVYLSNGSAWNKVTELKSYTEEFNSNISANANAIYAEVNRATQAEGNLSTRITQTAESITSKVDKNGIISEINQSSESVSISASKINLNGAVTANNNLKINTDGTIEAVNAKIQGNVETGSSSGNKITLNSGVMRTYWNNNQMMDIGYTTLNDFGGVRFNATNNAKFLALCANNVAKLIINNGYTPDGYVDSMYIFGGLQMQGHINMAYNKPIYFFSGAVNENGSQVHRIDGGWVNNVWSIHTSGSFWTEKNFYYQGGIYQVSDKRKKHGIEYLSDERIDNVFDSIDSCLYQLDDFEEDKQHFGFIAQDVESAVNDNFGDDMSIIGGYGDGYKSLNYTEMIPILWAEVKRLKKRIEELEKGDK